MFFLQHLTDPSTVESPVILPLKIAAPLLPLPLRLLLLLLLLLLQVHKVVGSFDFLGDPVGLLSNLSTGVKDFFYEPIEGLRPDGKGFLYGLGKGGTSLVSNTMQVGSWQSRCC